MTVAHTTRSPAPAALEITDFNQPSNRDLQSDGSRSIVLHGAHDAKAKFVNPKAKHEVLAAIIGLGPRKPALMSALIDCAFSADTATEVARRHSVHNSVLSYWSRKLGFPKRRRGRHAFLHPTPKHLRILELGREHGIAETARRVGVSKQRVSQIAHRWKHYLPLRSLRVQEPDGGDREKEIAKMKEPRIRVISFRLSLAEVQLLRQRYPDVPSVGQAARGIVIGVVSIRKRPFPNRAARAVITRAVVKRSL